MRRRRKLALKRELPPVIDVTVQLVVDEAYQPHEDWSALPRAVESAFLASHAVGPAALSLVITSAEAVQALNRQFVGEDAPTDVLAFPTSDDPTATEPGEPPYLGDVVIAYPVAREQASQAGHPTQSELQLLAIHGVLHLLGYDHATPDQEAEMWAFQSAALDALKGSR
jgi:probable rRNA maturation factor